MRVVRTFEWDAAHRVTQHESLCRFLHGHRYKAEVEVQSLSGKLDEKDMVVDFGVVKELVGEWIAEHWDHNALANRNDVVLITTAGHFGRSAYLFDGEPTAENIAAELERQAQYQLDIRDYGLRVTRVRVYETPNCWAETETLHTIRQEFGE